MPLCAADLGEETDADELFIKPLAARGDIVAIGGVCRDAGKAEEIEELGEMGIHGGSIGQKMRNSKSEISIVYGATFA
jgi:hypothetical protein